MKLRFRKKWQSLTKSWQKTLFKFHKKILVTRKYARKSWLRVSKLSATVTQTRHVFIQTVWVLETLSFWENIADNPIELCWLYITSLELKEADPTFWRELSGALFWEFRLIYVDMKLDMQTRDHVIKGKNGDVALHNTREDTSFLIVPVFLQEVLNSHKTT